MQHIAVASMCVRQYGWPGSIIHAKTTCALNRSIPHFFRPLALSVVHSPLNMLFAISPHGLRSSVSPSIVICSNGSQNSSGSTAW